MSYNKGNKFAEKWTVETVQPILDKMLVAIRKKGNKYITIIGLFCDFGLYRDLWAYWRNKFSDNEDVFRAIKGIEAHFESILAEKALSGDHNTTMSIFLLKNNHGYRDQTEINHRNNGGAFGADALRPVPTEVLEKLDDE